MDEVHPAWQIAALSSPGGVVKSQEASQPQELSKGLWCLCSITSSRRMPQQAPTHLMPSLQSRQRYYKETALVVPDCKPGMKAYASTALCLAMWPQDQ